MLGEDRVMEAAALPACLTCRSWFSPPNLLENDHPWSLSICSHPGYITPPE